MTEMKTIFGGLNKPRVGRSRVRHSRVLPTEVESVHKVWTGVAKSS